MSERGHRPSEKIFTIVFLSWFILSIFALIASAKAQQMGWVSIVFGQYFVVFGIAGIVLDIIKQKKCMYAVQGKCVEVKWHYGSSNNGRRTKTYCPVYEYYYNGQSYTGSQEIYTNLIHVGEGEYREIFLNPNKPTVFYEKGMSRTFNWISLIIGIAFVVVSTVAIYAYNFM